MAVNEHNMGGANGDAERDPGLGRLYREAAGETPPAHLDAAILAAARREVGARPRALAPALRRWHVPVSIAAVVIVSVSLVILVRDEGPMLMRDDRTMTMKAPEVPEEERRHIEQVAAPPTQPMQAEAQRRSLQPPAAKPGLQPLPAAPPPVAEERAAPALADTVTAGRTAAAPAAPSELPAARSAADAPQAKPMSGIRAAKVSGQDRPLVWHGFDNEPPEKWLARIEELRKQGRTAEAEEMLSEFRRRFPEHPVPPASK